MNSEIAEERAGKRVLVVEDNPCNANVLCLFLEGCGLAYEHVENGRDAVVKAAETSYDAILMDVMLPLMNGLEATRRILAEAPLDKKPYVIGLSGKSGERDLQRFEEAGFSETLPKPVDFKRLRKLLEKQIGFSSESDADEEMADAAEPSKTPPSDGVCDPSVVGAFVERMGGVDSSEGHPIKRFSSTLEESLVKLEDAVLEEDWSQIEHWAHSIKGMAGMVGARNLEDFSRQLEAIAGEDGSRFRPEHWLSLVAGSAYLLKDALKAYE